MTTHLLLIDPDIPFGVSLKQALEGTGDFRVSLAANGAAGEEIGSQADFDVVVMGFDPPDMDMMELIRRVRLLQPDTPLILCPETTVQHERARFMVADGSMGKPFTAREFIPYLHKVLRRSKGPEITPPTPGVQDEFVPPEMPSALRDFTRPGPPQPAQSPTDLLDWMERQKLQQHLEDLGRRDTESPARPGAADILEEFEALERARDGQAGEPAEPQASDAPETQVDSDGAPPLSADDESPGVSPAWPGADQTSGIATHRLSALGEEPPETRHLQPEDEPADTQRLRDTEQLPPRSQPSSTVRLEWDDVDSVQRATDGSFDNLIEEEGWSVRDEPDTAPSDSQADEPARRPGDTPTVPPHDLEGVRQFLATDQGMHDPYDFGEVLDAVAQSPPSDYERLAHDPEFHDLVDSMRVPEGTRPRRTRLDDLLASIAADLPEETPLPEPDGALDYVLEAIRRGAAPIPPAEEEPPDSDLGNATIGDVIEGLFDPSFEGVLAALAGKEIGEDIIDEPTYGRAAEAAESLEPSVEDQFRPEEMSADEDQPAWLLAYEVEEIVPPQPPPEQPRIEEPPITEEDSSHYPATTALTAVTGAQESDDFSLDRLLEQIERQLPPPRSSQPHLKPLPSWQKPGQIESATDLAALFDRMEGKEIQQVTPDAAAETPDDSVPAEFAEAEDVPAPDVLTEPPLATQDTRPSPSIREALNRVPVQETDTTPVAPVLPDEPVLPEEADSGPMEPGDFEAVAALERLFEGEEQPLPADQAEYGSMIAEADLLAPDEEWEAEQPPELVEEVGTGEMLSAPDLFAPDEEWEAEQPPELVEEIETGEMLSAPDLFAPDEEWEAEQPPELAQEVETGEMLSAPDLFAPDEEWEAEQPPELAQEVETGEMMAEESLFALDERPSEVVEEPDYAEPVLDEDIIAQAFFEGVRSTAEHDTYDLFREERAAPPDEAEDERYLHAAVPADQEAAEGIFEPDIEHLVPVPVEEAFLLLESESFPEEEVSGDEEEERLVQAAVLLTQYSLESSAQATMLSRPGKLLAQAGDLPSVAMQRLFQVVDAAWMTSTASSDALIRFITLPEAGEFLLYSTQVDYDLILSMAFNANTPVRTIRRQARRLSESLDLVPEEVDEPPAAKTEPSRPTAPRPPAGLHEAVATLPPVAEAELVAGPLPDEEAGPYTTYTCLWLPRDPGQELLGYFADALREWIVDIVDDSAWELHHLDIRPDYLVLSLSVPQKTLPDTAVTLLMDETARRSAREFPDVVNGGALWADGYYVVAPPRELSEREIARFITYQRQAQLG
jgi:CheY-like chemotaxis protein/REP element-mobilizing transposase RayT